MKVQIVKTLALGSEKQLCCLLIEMPAYWLKVSAMSLISKVRTLPASVMMVLTKMCEWKYLVLSCTRNKYPWKISPVWCLAAFSTYLAHYQMDLGIWVMCLAMFTADSMLVSVPFIPNSRFLVYIQGDSRKSPLG